MQASGKNFLHSGLGGWQWKFGRGLLRNYKIGIIIGTTSCSESSSPALISFSVDPAHFERAMHVALCANLESDTYKLRLDAKHKVGMELERTQKAATTRTLEGASGVCDCAESIPRLSLNLTAQIGNWYLQPERERSLCKISSSSPVAAALFKTAKGRLA